MPVGSGEDMFGSAEPTVDSYHYGDMNSGRGAAGGPVRPGQKKPGNGKTVMLAVAASLVLLVGVALAVKLILELRGGKGRRAGTGIYGNHSGSRAAGHP